jgi:pantetheine-phosphate adenylyltransferase
MKRIAIYPGSFDPVTNGHLDIIERASHLFDRLIVALVEDPEKESLFSEEERAKMLRKATAYLDNIAIERFSGLLVDYAKKKKARAIIRGLRAVSDFEYEFQMALMNKKLQEEIETVFMATKEVYSYLSSSIVKEVALLGGSVKGLVPPIVEKRLKEKIKRGSYGRTKKKDFKIKKR